MEFPWKGKAVIITTKALPFSASERVCSQISRWEKCPILRVDAILEKLYERKGYNDKQRPSMEEEDDLQHHAFSIACGVAESQMSVAESNLKCVIIQSHLDRLFQLDQLIQLSSMNDGDDPHKVIILELRFRHKYSWKIHAEHRISTLDTTKRWFVPKSWNEIEQAIVDYDAKAWDKYYDAKCGEVKHMKRLVLDPFVDIGRYELESREKTSLFGKVIEHLLNDQGVPFVVEYRAWRKKLVQGLISSPNNNNDIKLCSNTGADCVFVKSNKDDNKCRACDKDSSYYNCISCSRALCKPCAELTPHPVDIDNLYSDLVGMPSRPRRTQTRACKSCSDGGKAYSDSCGGCLFETHLKCSRLVPTVVDNPLLHPHLLSLQFTPDLERGEYYCSLCRISGLKSGYYCIICNYPYHLICVHSPLQLEHCHGGHHHLLNLVLPPPDKDEVAFSRDDYLNPDDFWCEVCYRNIDSSAAYYSCQYCPQYVAHLFCISKLWKGVEVFLRICKKEDT